MTRGRPRAINPSRALTTHLDEAWMARLDLHLFSEVEGRVPKGAYQAFFNERLREFFATEALDLSPYVGALPGEQTIRGKPEALLKLAQVLEGEVK